MTSPLPVEAFAPVAIQSTCSSTPKPGVVDFRKFVIDHQGGGDSGITRDCGIGGASEHKEGRAWDWTMSVAKDSAAVQVLLDWLLANDAEAFRRFGLMYMIWNRQIWSTKTKSWQPYGGASPHTDHVHFSFSWPGALAQTSGFQWLGVASATLPEAGTERYVAAAIGVAAGFVAAKRFL